MIENKGEVVGVKVESKSFFDYTKLSSFWEYLGALVDTVMSSLTRIEIDEDPAKTIRVSGNESTLDLRISKSVAEKMVERGYEETDEQI